MAAWQQTQGSGEENLVGLPREMDAGRQPMILVLFEGANLSSGLVENAVDQAEATSSELVLLCVRSPDKMIPYGQEGEQLFSGLKSIQAQLPQCAVPIRIETVTGAAAQLVLDYVHQSGTDLIVVPGQSIAPTSRRQA